MRLLIVKLNGHQYADSQTRRAWSKRNRELNERLKEKQIATGVCGRRFCFNEPPLSSIREHQDHGWLRVQGDLFWDTHPVSLFAILLA